MAMAFDLRPGISFCALIFALITLFSHGACENGKSKIVFVAMPMANSPYFNCLELGEELIRRGHEVSILTTELIKTRKSTVKHIEYKLPNIQNAKELISMAGNVSFKFGPSSMIKAVKGFSQIMLDSCFEMLKDSRTKEKLQEADVIITVSIMSCGHYIADILDKPTISLHPASLSVISSLTGLPTLSCCTPAISTSFTDEMTFPERVQNFLMVQAKDLFMNIFTSFYFRELQSAYNWKSKGSFSEVFGKTEMVIVTLDYSYQYVTPQMPNTFFVGPLLAKPAKELPKDLEDFMQSSGEHGVVLLAFGSSECSLDKAIVERILTAISRMKQKFIWKLKSTENLTIPPNLMALNWVPQNDILGHKKTKAFVSHMGINGAAEAIYHGVPMLAAPFLGERFHNAKLFVKKVKMAKFIDLLNADADTWQSSIEEVIYNESYREHAIMTSKQMRSWPKSGVERAGDLVQYVLDNGGRLPHLKSNANSLYWFQYYCVDVVAFLLALSLLLPYVAFKVVRFFLYLVLKNVRKSKTD